MEKIYIYPTDTVWGIGAKISDGVAHRRINQLKGTNDRKPLSIIMSDFRMFDDFIDIGGRLKSLNLPEMFDLGLTLGLPHKYFKITIPKHIYQNSPFVGVRISFNGEVSKLIREVNEPISTTSLNKTGDSPILKNADAKIFYQKHKDEFPELRFCGEGCAVLSGVSSSFLIIGDDDVRFLRRGENADKILSYL